MLRLFTEMARGMAPKSLALNGKNIAERAYLLKTADN